MCQTDTPYEAAGSSGYTVDDTLDHIAQRIDGHQERFLGLEGALQSQENAFSEVGQTIAHRAQIQDNFVAA
jgi:hypothetical protein